jgi:beta-lactamase regulating signal transducer with metallopeptidase domain
MMDALLDLTIKSTVLLGIGALMVLLMRRASASSRHLVWTAALCAVALLPISRLGLPAWKLAVLSAPVAQPAASPLLATPLMAPEPLTIRSQVNAPGSGTDLPVPSVAASVAAPVSTAAPIAPAFVISAAVAIVAVWWLGVAILGLRALAGHVLLRRLTSRATIIEDPRARAMVEHAAQAFGVRRHIALLAHEHDGLPCTFGVVRPVILIPTSALVPDPAGISRLRAVLTHEIAHIARLDAISERITQVAVMMFWFNPLVWIAAHQARFERERAADDSVLAGGTKASDYAGDLVAIARTQSRALRSSAVPMAVSGLERRVRAILDRGVTRGRQSRVSVAMALIVVAATLPLSAVRLVARSAPLREPSSSARAPYASSPAPADELIVRATATPVEQSDPLAVWNTESLRNLRQVLRLAAEAHQEALTKVAIGTKPPVDVAVLETTVSRLEEAVKAFTPGTAPLTAQDLKSRRAVFSAALRSVESAGRRFTNGSISTTELSRALLVAAQTIDPSIQAPAPPGSLWAAHTSPLMFLPPPAGAAPQQESDQLAAWNAERTTNMRQVVDRARKAYADALTKVNIGTLAQIDTIPLETALAQILQMNLAAQANTILPPVIQIEAARARFTAALKDLEAMQVRFDNGLVTTQNLANMLVSAARSLSTQGADTGAHAATLVDRNNAKALYELLSGRVTSISGNVQADTATGHITANVDATNLSLTDAGLLTALRNVGTIAADADRADALVGLAQKYAFTPEMVTAYVAAANSIKTPAQRDRVFAQAIRVKSPDR